MVTSGDPVREPTLAANSRSLSRIEGRIALGQFVKRFPKLRADGDRKVLPLARFRGYSSFPIRV